MSFSVAEEVILSKSQISKQTFFKIHNLPFHRHSNRHVFSYLEKADNPINMREKNLNFKIHLSLLKPASIQLPCIKGNIYTLYNIPETGWVVELLVTLLQWDPQHCIGTYNMYLSLQQNSKGNYRIFKNLID